jgi:hypothetical protein
MPGPEALYPVRKDIMTPPLDGRQVVFIQPEKKIEVRIYPNGLGTCSGCSHWSGKAIKIFTGTDPLYPIGLCRRWFYIPRGRDNYSCSLWNGSKSKGNDGIKTNGPKSKGNDGIKKSQCTSISIKKG